MISLNPSNIPKNHSTIINRRKTSILKGRMKVIESGKTRARDKGIMKSKEIEKRNLSKKGKTMIPETNIKKIIEADTKRPKATLPIRIFPRTNPSQKTIRKKNKKTEEMIKNIIPPIKSTHPTPKARKINP
jgi:hypothetical protein